jgi:hypothetical protein
MSVTLDREDAVALVSSHHGSRSDDSGQKMLEDSILPFLPHISSISVCTGDAIS